MWLFMLAIGCDEATLCQDAAAYEPAVQVGWGEDAFHPLTDAPLDAVYGPQMGKHVWLAFSGQGLVAGTQIGWSELVAPPQGEFELHDADGAWWGDAYIEAPWSGDEAEARIAGVQLVVSWEWFMWDPEYAEDGQAEPPEDAPSFLTGTIEDVCGTVVEIDQELVISALD